MRVSIMMDYTKRAREPNKAYDVVVRHMATGTDYHIHLWAENREHAERRARVHARRARGITAAKMRMLNGEGIAVFRIVSSDVSPNQTKGTF